MNGNPFVNYLKYVRDVLGVHSVLTESALAPLREHFFYPDENFEIEKKWQVLFVNSIFVADESLFEKQNFELFEKMKKAMNLPVDSSLAVDASAITTREILRRWRPYGPPQVLIVFKQNPDLSSGLHYIDETSVLETYSPYQMLHQPELKKITWTHLQQVMAFLSRN